MQTVIDLVLYCPTCGRQHIDKGSWANEAHKSHKCESCGFVWRPSDSCTRGVEKIFTKGTQDDKVFKPLTSEVMEWLTMAAEKSCPYCDGQGIYLGNVHLCSCIFKGNQRYFNELRESHKND
jgi:hypothetical protein